MRINGIKFNSADGSPANQYITDEIQLLANTYLNTPPSPPKLKKGTKNNSKTQKSIKKQLENSSWTPFGNANKNTGNHEM